MYNSEDVINFNLDEIKYKIFAKSYLGFGLNSARLGIFKSDTLCLLKSKSNSRQVYISVLKTYIIYQEINKLNKIKVFKSRNFK